MGINRRRFSTLFITCLALGYTQARQSVAAALLAPPEMPGDGLCGPFNQAAFHSHCGSDFTVTDGVGSIPASLRLEAVEAAHHTSEQQFYLRFSHAGVTTPAEGIYRLRHGRQELALYLQPVAQRPGLLEAVINTQTR